MLAAPHSRRSQLPSAAAKMHDFVQRRPQIESSENMVTVGSALVGELSEEAVTAGNIAGDPMIVDLSVDERETVTGWSGDTASGCPFDLGRLTALSLNRLYFGRSYAINLEAEPGVRGFVERDPCGPHTQNFGNQRREIGDVPAIGAGENPCRRPFACRRRDRQDRAPLSTDRPSCCRAHMRSTPRSDHREWRRHDNPCQYAIRPRLCIHPPLVVRGKCKARHLTVAGFDVGAFDAPCTSPSFADVRLIAGLLAVMSICLTVFGNVGTELVSVADDMSGLGSARSVR